MEAPYVVQFVHYNAPGDIDVHATTQNLNRQHYFVSDYVKDEHFPLFVLDAIENRWNEIQFVEHLDRYNNFHEYLKISDSLDNDFALKDAEEFLEYYVDDFCDMYPNITPDMLRLDGGSDWKHLPVYADLGLQFMDMVKAFMQQVDGARAAEARAQDDTRCVRRKIA
jgi:hypothetical protein